MPWVGGTSIRQSRVPVVCTSIHIKYVVCILNTFYLVGTFE